MNIVVSTNRKYVKYLFVLMASIFINVRENVTFYILVKEGEFDSKTEEDLRKFALTFKQKVDIVYINESIFNDFRVTSNWSVEIYFRLMAHEFLPKEVDRVLYLDVDTLVIADISEFYFSDFKDKHLIACRGAKAFLGESDNLDYFNSGVMLMNLNKFRESIKFDTYLNYISQKKNYFLDEGMLNELFSDSVILRDPCEYNCFPSFYPSYLKFANKNQTKFDVKIVHYAVGRKPWDFSDGKNYLVNEWWNYARVTPCYGQLLEEMNVKKEYFDRVQNRLNQKADDRINHLKNDRDKFSKYTYVFKFLMLNEEEIIKSVKNMNISDIAFYGDSEVAKVLSVFLKRKCDIDVKYVVENKENPMYDRVVPRNSKSFDKVNLMVITDLMNIEKIRTKMKKFNTITNVISTYEFLGMDTI